MNDNFHIFVTLDDLLKYKVVLVSPYKRTSAKWLETRDEDNKLVMMEALQGDHFKFYPLKQSDKV